MNARQDGLEKDPFVPYCLPTRKASAGASEKAAKVGNGAAEIANGPVGGGALIQPGKNLKNLPGNERGGRQIRSEHPEWSQAKHAHARRSQESEHILESSTRVHARVSLIYLYSK